MMASGNLILGGFNRLLPLMPIASSVISQSIGYTVKVLSTPSSFTLSWGRKLSRTKLHISDHADGGFIVGRQFDSCLMTAHKHVDENVGIEKDQRHSFLISSWYSTP